MSWGWQCDNSPMRVIFVSVFLIVFIILVHNK